MLQVGDDFQRSWRQLADIVNAINQKSFFTDLEISEVIRLCQTYDGQVVGSKEQYVKEIMWTDKRQGIVVAEITDKGGIRLGITAKAAGFVIGPNGNSIRGICLKTGARSHSWILRSRFENFRQELMLRMMEIEGSLLAIIRAVDIIQTAVGRYADLIEGRVDDLEVDSVQVIEGVNFEYKPPPLSEMRTAVRTYRDGELSDRGPAPSLSSYSDLPSARSSIIYNRNEFYPQLSLQTESLDDICSITQPKNHPPSEYIFPPIMNPSATFPPLPALPATPFPQLPNILTHQSPRVPLQGIVPFQGNVYPQFSYMHAYNQPQSPPGTFLEATQVPIFSNPYNYFSKDVHTMFGPEIVGYGNTPF